MDYSDLLTNSAQFLSLYPIGKCRVPNTRQDIIRSRGLKEKKKTKKLKLQLITTTTATTTTTIITIGVTKYRTIPDIYRSSSNSSNCNCISGFLYIIFSFFFFFFWLNFNLPPLYVLKADLSTHMKKFTIQYNIFLGRVKV